MTAQAETLPATTAPQTLPAAAKPKAELVTGARVAAIIPRDIEEVARIANAVIVAGLAPDSYKGNDDKGTASKIMIGILKGAEIGLPPLTALANIAIINGRPCLWGDGAVALIQASGKVESWEESFDGDPNTDDYTAICSIHRVGQAAPYIGKFSWADAKRARLTAKGPWVQYPGVMLMWRARTKAMRTGFADCLSGLSIAEEANDIPAAPAPVAADILEDDKPEVTAEPVKPSEAAE